MLGPYPLRRFARPGLVRWSSPRTGTETGTDTATETATDTGTDTATDTATGSFVA